MAKEPKAKGAPPAPIMGRPTDYSTSLSDEICDHIAEGKSLASWCRDNSTGYSSVMRWLETHEYFRENYRRARLHSADADADLANDVRDRVIAGELAPDIARVVLDSIKWTSGKRNPKKYGERMVLAGDEDAPIVTREISRREKAKAMALLVARARQPVDG